MLYFYVDFHRPASHVEGSGHWQFLSELTLNPPCTFEGDIKILQRREVLSSINKIFTSPVVSIYTKKVPLLALGLSRRPGSASQLRLVPPKRRIVTKMEQEPVGASWSKSSSEIFHIFIHWNKCLSWIPLLSISLIIHLQSDSHWSVAQYFDVQSVQLYALARGKCGTILVAAVVLSHIQNLAIGLNIALPWSTRELSSSQHYEHDVKQDFYISGHFLQGL